MKRFDTVVMVDWSAAGRPVTGADSIWWAEARRTHGLIGMGNPPTRLDARHLLTDMARRSVEAGRRILIGFDFPFGFARGTVARLGGSWLALRERLAAALPDAPDNRQERFAVGQALNVEGWPDGPGPFWGHGTAKDAGGLPNAKPAGYGDRLPPRLRLAEEAAKRRFGGGKTQEAWKLAGNGSVGSQALTGIAALHRMQADIPGAAFWPFDGEDAAREAPVLLTEIYPSIHPLLPALGETKDAAQVRGLALHMANDPAELETLLLAPFRLPEAERAAVVGEEGWILGVPA